MVILFQELSRDSRLGTKKENKHSERNRERNSIQCRSGRSRAFQRYAAHTTMNHLLQKLNSSIYLRCYAHFETKQDRSDVSFWFIKVTLTLKHFSIRLYIQEFYNTRRGLRIEWKDYYNSFNYSRTIRLLVGKIDRSMHHYICYFYTPPTVCEFSPVAVNVRQGLRIDEYLLEHHRVHLGYIHLHCVQGTCRVSNRSVETRENDIKKILTSKKISGGQLPSSNFAKKDIMSS